MQNQMDYGNWHLSMAESEARYENPLYPWHETVLKLLPDPNGKRVLESGCGRGDFACQLGELYPRARIVATDLSDAAIAFADSKERQYPNV